MDIISHTLTGVALSTTLLPFSRSKLKSKLAIVIAGGTGGLLPDIDAISLWSKFDGTIGMFLHLSYSGKEIYFSKLWYSHHGFLHSIAAGLLLTILIGLVISFRSGKISYKQIVSSQTKLLVLCSLLLGFVFHLLEDMLTPSSVWGGVRLFWPSSVYIGGTGQIWWWNNYDIFLIICSVLLINLMIVFLPIVKGKTWFYLPAVIFVLGFMLSVKQIKTRSVDFSYTGFTRQFTEYEKKSKEVQKEILGKRIYELMNGLDNKIPFNF